MNFLGFMPYAFEENEKRRMKRKQDEIVREWIKLESSSIELEWEIGEAS